MFGERRNKLMKDILVNKINRKRPLDKPRTQWMDIIAQYIENINEKINNSQGI